VHEAERRECCSWGKDGRLRVGVGEVAGHRDRLVERLESMARIVKMTTTSLNLDRIDRLVGEAHDLLTTLMPSLEPSAGSVGGIVKGGLASWQVRLVTRYIDDHLSERLAIHDLARSVALSTSHFGRAFRQTFGRTPMKHVRAVRLDRAKRLMRQTDLSLSEIALECGFSDQAHFTRRFRAATAAAPRSWRRGVDRTGLHSLDPSPAGHAGGRMPTCRTVTQSGVAPVAGSEQHQSDSSSL